MDVVIIAPAIGLILCAAVLGIFFARLISRDRIYSPADVPADLVPETLFTPSRYRAMQRLLEEAGLRFLSSHPGCTPQLKKKFRKVRIKIFRGYMQQLAKDFNRMCKAIKLHMIHSERDRSELASVVMKEQFRFAVAMMYAEFRLMLYGVGWSRVDVTSLIQSFEGMRMRLHQLAAIAEPSGA